jgi:hypothetical protein
MTEPELIEAEGASCAVWRRGPTVAGRPAAAIGRFHCEDASAGARLLASLARRLGSEGIRQALGPMDGDTWHSYRLVTDAGSAPPFFLEPTNPAHHVAAFEAAGFSPVSRYVSLVDRSLAPKAEVRRLPDIAIRTWRAEEAEGELQRLHELSLRAFARNAFYRPIGLEEFALLYRPLVPLVDPNLVLFAQAPSGATLGFLFAIPDRLQGAAPTTLIVKTYASLMPGVGGLLGDHFYSIARARGARAVIHALVHEDNLSLKHSRSRHGEIFRRYALFGRSLA